MEPSSQTIAFPSSRTPSGGWAISKSDRVPFDSESINKVAEKLPILLSVLSNVLEDADYWEEETSSISW